MSTHGETFGPYRLEKPLGRGGMGEVYRAYDTSRDRYVALKLLTLVVVDDESRARLERECNLLATLRHPRIVELLDHGEIDGRPYLATRLIDGTDLERRLERGALDPAYGIRILTQVADALDAAHAAGIVHRDVKPANILLAGDEDERVYLADFGIAKPLGADATALTRTGEIGTLDYMAPERLTGRDVDGRADVYALACVLFKCLTGKLPFPAEDPAAKLAAQLNDPPPTPSLFGRGIPAALDLVVATGMDKDPARRYPTAGQLMAAAGDALARSDPPPRPAPTANPVASPDTGPIMRAIVSVAAHEATHRAETRSRALPDRSPYPGLRSFGEQEADLFRGREPAITEVLVRLSRLSTESGPLIVTGASGTGKSSLLRAGVLPALVAAEPRWPQVVLTPGPNPFGTLAARLAPILRMDAGELTRRLRARPTDLGHVCSRVEPGRLVLVVDQFEELFTAGSDQAERTAFAAALTHARPALAVVSVRADFLDRCLRLAPLKPALAQPFLLSPLGAGDLERVIVEPARLAGYDLEAGLVDRLITDVGARGGFADDPGVLPRLAHALRQTWERRSGRMLTLRAYQETGGVDRAVALTADGVYHRLPETDRPQLRAALLRMVSVVDTGGLARRRAARDEVPGHLVDRLVEARLATADTDGVQLSHEALLTAWPRLRQWVEEDRQNLLLRQRLGEAAAAWESSGRDSAELYRGARLAAVLDWAEGRTDLAAAENAFLAESRRLQRRTTRRLRATVGALAGLLVLALVAGGLAFVARNDAEQQARAAEREAATARSRQLAAESLAAVDTDPVQARRDALEAWRTAETEEARSALLSNVVADYPATFESGVTTPYVTDVTADGRYIAVGGEGGELSVIDTRTRQPIDANLGHDDAVTGVAFSPDGQLLATVSTDLKIWVLPGGQLLRRVPNVGGSVAWRSDGSVVAAGSDTRDGYGIGEWNPRTGRRRGWLIPPETTNSGAYSIEYGADDTRLAIGRGDGTVELLDTTDAKRLLTSRPHVEAVGGPESSAYVTVSDDYLASGTQGDPLIRLWDIESGKAVNEVFDPGYAAAFALRSGPVKFSADGQHLLSPNAQGNIVLGLSPAIPQSEQFATYARGPSGTGAGRAAIADLAVSERGDIVATLLNGSVRRWRRNPYWHTSPSGRVTDVAFDPRDGKLSAAAWDAVHTWDKTTGDRTHLPGHRGAEPYAVAYAPDGTMVVGRNHATLTVTTPGGRNTRIHVPNRQLEELTVSPDGSLIAAAIERLPVADGRTEFEIRVWERTTGQQVGVVALESGRRPDAIQFTPDGHSLVGALRMTDLEKPYRSDIFFWRARDLSELKVVPAGRVLLGDATFTPDGDLLTVTDTGRIQVRDPRTAKIRRTFGSHPAAIRAMALSPDGRTVATITSEDTLVRLWDLDTGKRIARLSGHVDTVNDVEFSPDGRLLASAGVDTDVGLWLVDPNEAAEQICADLADAGERNLKELGC